MDSVSNICELIRKGNLTDFLKIDDEIIVKNAYHLLKLCAFYGSPKIASSIYSKLSNKDTINNSYLLRLSVAVNKPHMIKLFVDNGASVTDIDNHALKIACCNGYYDVAKILISFGADVKACNNYCLQVAASNGNNEIVKLLVRHDARVDDNDNHAIRWAQSNRHNDTVELLKKLGAKKNMENITLKKYILRVEANETSFWLTRELYDEKDNLIDTDKLSYDD
ncbi:ankyrin repeat protein [Tupanvirus soda lake]|uniref:Ankyrin repeat protein n=1 Tax=Tupanvirus deep ocean TaxID=2126984 RepID=A0AC59HCB6_9VIRU|nr:ankyrin repeat protein [Tupanvirus soda lake]AUL78414.2 ankyrin repeat protein [Tupanvirus soda lake]